MNKQFYTLFLLLTALCGSALIVTVEPVPAPLIAWNNLHENTMGYKGWKHSYGQAHGQNYETEKERLDRQEWEKQEHKEVPLPLLEEEPDIAR